MIFNNHSVFHSQFCIQSNIQLNHLTGFCFLTVFCFNSKIRVQGLSNLLWRRNALNLRHVDVCIFWNWEPKNFLIIRLKKHKKTFFAVNWERGNGWCIGRNLPHESIKNSNNFLIRAYLFKGWPASFRRLSAVMCREALHSLHPCSTRFWSYPYI